MLAVELAIILYYIPGTGPLPLLLGVAGFLLLVIFLLILVPHSLILFVRILAHLTNRVTVWVIASLTLIYYVIFSPFLVFLATNGNSTAFTYLNPLTWTHGGWFRSTELLFLLLAPAFLLLYPAWAHRWLPWKSTSKQTKSFITRVLSIGAVLSNGIFIFMLHFQRGPLSDVSPGPLAVGILFAVVLLVPYYRSAISACWKSGILHVIDADRWRAVLQTVLKEVQAGRVRATHALERSLAEPEDATEHERPADNTPIPLKSAHVNPGHPSDRR
jgi:hypothetical protein